MTTTCFICGLRISNAEGYALSILNIGNGDKNEAALICKEYHKKKMERQTIKEVEKEVKFEKLVELEKRVEQLEKKSFPFPPSPPPPPSILPTFTFNKNAHLQRCQCIRCFDLEDKTRL